MCAEVPPHRPDILITESTYGIHIHDKREEREKRFTGLVHDIVSRGGRCLIPAFALGRAQELMLILDEYWTAHPELQDIPIYYASQLASKCMAVYQTFIAAMNTRIRSQVTNNNPFCFRFISNLQVNFVVHVYKDRILYFIALPDVNLFSRCKHLIIKLKFIIAVVIDGFSVLLPFDVV